MEKQVETGAVYSVAVMRHTSDAQRAHREAVGDLIRRARERKGWTQAELGERVKMSRSTIHKYETGATTLGVDQVAAVAEELDLRPDAFVNPPPRRRVLEQDLDDYLVTPTG